MPLDDTDLADKAAKAGALVVTTDENGNVTVSEPAPAPRSPGKGFDENLAERPELLNYLPAIADDILQGIESDEASRNGWISNYTQGMDLLGLKIDMRSASKGQQRNTSKVRDTTLLEAVVKAQSQARGELLPAVGPAKVETVPDTDAETQQLAADFQADFNQALTVGMPEYVPDLDRGLFGHFYSGNMFRYGFHCPFRGRPVVETYPTEDLIVSEEATALETATRVTMRIPKMSPQMVRRQKFYGLWRDVELGSPFPVATPEQQKKDEIQGVRNESWRQQDQPFCIYQTITDLDLNMYGLPEEGAPPGLPLPYKVTIEKTSRQVLRIERYWAEGDTRYQRKRRLIHYQMVPGFGFLAYGFLHLQGNQTKALTAVIRLLLDALMFANFPGGVMAKDARTETNEINPGPGEWAKVSVPAGITDIRNVLMPFPYKEPSPVAIQLYELVQQAAARVGAAAMLEVGEGRANVPVGTIMAMLEEKSVVMSAVHKRMHEAMARELRMLRELYAENPAALEKVLPNPRRQWAAETEFADLNLVPASDPNVPSQVHRLMLATALATLLTMPNIPQHLDVDDVLKRVLRMIGISDVDNVVRPQAPAGPDPAAAAAMAAVNTKQIEAAQKDRENQRKAASEAVDAQQKNQEMQFDAANQAQDRAAQMRIAAMKEQTERIRLAAEEHRADAQMQREQQKDQGQSGGMQPAQPRTFGGDSF